MMTSSLRRTLQANRLWLGILISTLLIWLWPRVSPPALALVLIDFLILQSLPSRSNTEREATLWSIPAAILAGLVLWIHFYLLTRGTGEFFQPELLGSSYDSLAASLLGGTSELDPATIRWEAMKTDGRVYMYFGPWPALLRIPLNLTMESYWGLWSRLSCFVASTLALSAFMRLAMRSLLGNPRLDLVKGKLLFLASILAFGLGTPLLFLTITGSIYHESILWGLAASIWALDFAWMILVANDPSDTPLWGLSCAAGIALLSRVTFGAPLFGILAICLLFKWMGSGERSGGVRAPLAPRTAVTILPALAAAVLQAVYNMERFDSPLVFARFDLLGYLVSNHESWTSFETWGSLNVRRIPIAIFNFFGFQQDFVSSWFPWIRATRAWYPEANLYPQMFDSLVISLTLASPCVVFGSALGITWLFRSGGEWLLKLCVLGLFTECVFVFSYFIMEQRYAADFLPFLVLGFALFLRGPSKGAPSRIPIRWLVNGTLILALVSVTTTMLSSLSVIPRHGVAQPRVYKQAWIQLFVNINSSLSTSKDSKEVDAKNLRTP